MLELRALRASHGGVEVIRGVDLAVAEGETVGLIGSNGAGKSTLVRAICGLLRPDSGEILLGGHDLSTLAPEQIARLGVAVVPERRQVFRTLSVAENLRLAAQATDIDEHHGEKVLARFPVLEERSAQRADRLSGGERQQLAIARALLTKPELLILDEPSLGLAPKAIDLVYDLFKELRDEGVTMLLVEQSVTRAIEFCDRCAVLTGGEICTERSRDELRRDPGLARLYLGGP